MSSNTQRPKAPRREHMGYCLVQQVFAKAALDVLATLAHHHEAGDSSTAVNADLSILEVIETPSVHLLQGSRADIAFLAAADKEDFACVGVLDELQRCILADYKLTCAHAVCALDVVTLCHNCITITYTS